MWADWGEFVHHPLVTRVSSDLLPGHVRVSDLTVCAATKRMVREHAAYRAFTYFYMWPATKPYEVWNSDVSGT